jgi:hypothetical protein
MTSKFLAIIIAAACLTSPVAGSSAQAQSASQGQGGGFSFQGDQIHPMPDPSTNNVRDPRYTQTGQQQANGEIPKPGGGCLRYGAVGAAGGHLAGHGVLGALAGCATGAYVKHRDKARIRAQQADAPAQ